MSFKVSQGVTTVVAGNCGISAAPLRARHGRCRRRSSLLDAPAGSRFTTFAAYLRRAARHAVVGQRRRPWSATPRCARVTMAELDRPANADEIAAMRALVHEALEAGAIGMSTGTFYPPARQGAPTEEIIEVGRPLIGAQRRST